MTETAEPTTSPDCERCGGQGAFDVRFTSGALEGSTGTFACSECEGTGKAKLTEAAITPDPDSYTVVNVDAEQPKVGDTIRYLNRDHQPPIEQEGKIKGRDEPQPGLYAFHLDNEDTVHLCPPMPVKVLKQ